MNGDDMFATFFITNVPKNTIIWWFSRIYLYFFICLFIYVIVSLCISIILDAYEAISEFYKNKEPPKSMLKVCLKLTFIYLLKKNFQTRNSLMTIRFQYLMAHFTTTRLWIKFIIILHIFFDKPELFCLAISFPLKYSICFILKQSNLTR